MACVRLCVFWLQGLYGLAEDILGSAKQRFPPSSQHAHLWMTCEQTHVFERAILQNKHQDAEQALVHMAAVNELEAKYQ